MSYSKNATTGLIAIEDTNDYYPFGLSFINTSASKYSPSTTYKNTKYNGKELQESGMYDYGARFYMPDVARWGVVDPLAEKFFDYTGYNYVLNNPAKFVDKDGMDVYLLNEEGKFILAKKQEGDDVVYGYNSKTGDLNDNNGDKKGDYEDGIRIKTKGLVGQFLSLKDGNKGDTYKGYRQSIKEYSTEVENDMFNLFYYAARNVGKVEFSLGDFNIGGKRYISVQTYSLYGYSPGPDQIGVDKSNVNRFFHNHPGDALYHKDYTEMNSMGRRNNGSYYNDGGDFASSKTFNYPNYVFFPKSGNLYNVTKKGVYLIKKLNNQKKSKDE